MKRSASLYNGHRFPPEIIQHAVWLYHRFNLSTRDIEDLLAERGISVSYGVAHRELIPNAIHDTSRYANNRAEVSHQPTRARERGMRRFKSQRQAQRFLGVQSAVQNLFNLGRHLISAKHYREIRQRAFASWQCATRG
jgi:transposase-like protein